MALSHSPLIVTNGLTMCLDAANIKSYSGSGTSWNDLSSGKNNGTLTNSPTFSNNTFTFNGSNQYVTGSGTPVGINAYTKCIWFKLNSLSVDNNLLSSDTGGHFMYIPVSGTPKLYCGHSDWGNYQAFPSTTTFTTGVWYQACLTFDTTNGMILYINGTQDATYSALKTSVSGTGVCNIGCFSLGGNLLGGIVSQALVYNRVLTAQEVLQNYNAIKGRFI